MRARGMAAGCYNLKIQVIGAIILFNRVNGSFCGVNSFSRSLPGKAQRWRKGFDNELRQR
jgi:hypothetical protein